jgi:hypothetical protein
VSRRNLHAAAARHRRARVEREVEEHLFELARVRAHGRQLAVERELELDRVA